MQIRSQYGNKVIASYSHIKYVHFFCSILLEIVTCLFSYNKTKEINKYELTVGKMKLGVQEYFEPLHLSSLIVSFILYCTVHGRSNV